MRTSPRGLSLFAVLLLAGACDSNPANPDAARRTCGFSVAETAREHTVGAAGGSVAVPVTADAGCDWTAKSNVDFLTISPEGGKGSGTITITAVPNAGGERSGTLLIAGVTITVKQSTAPCALNQSSQTISAAGATGTVVITGNCSWTASSNVSWLRITTADSGNGSGSVGFAADPNPGPDGRSGTLTIAGQTFTVNQEPPASCTLSINRTNQTVAASGGGGTVFVTAASGCGWTATSNATWLHVTSGAAGSGNGSVGFTVDSNGAAVARSGTLTIAGQTFTVNQEPFVQCPITIDPTFQIVPMAGGVATITVTVGTSSCGWFALNNALWIRITSGGGNRTGNGSIGLTVDANPGPGGRTGTVAFSPIGGVSGSFPYLVINQDGLNPPPTCIYSIDPTSGTYTALGGGPQSVTVNTGSGCSWAAASNVPWVHILGSDTGIGIGTAAFYVDANAGPPRSGTLTIAGLTFTVNQSGP